MQRTRKKAKIIREAVDEWASAGLLETETADRLRDSVETLWIDWKRLSSISIRIAIVCIVISVFTLLADKAIVAMLLAVLNLGAIARIIVFATIAALFFRWGIRRRQRKPDRVRTTDIIFLFGVLFVAFAIASLGEALRSESTNVSPLVLLGAVIYAGLGFLIPSRLIWIIALGCFGAWFGLLTGYVSGWGAYYLGMNYPVRFVFFGALLTGAGYVLQRIPRFAALEKSTRAIGLLYLFIALWIMSIFGNYGDMDTWYEAPQFELLHWSLLFGVAALIAIYIGLRTDDGMMRGFGITFLFINLYTRYFEYFWDTLHASLFFAIMGVSFWYIGARAERIWSLGGRVRDKESEPSKQDP